MKKITVCFAYTTKFILEILDKMFMEIMTIAAWS